MVPMYPCLHLTDGVGIGVDDMFVSVIVSVLVLVSLLVMVLVQVLV